MPTQKQLHQQAMFARQARTGTGKVGKAAKSTAAPKPKRRNGKVAKKG